MSFVNKKYTLQQIRDSFHLLLTRLEEVFLPFGSKYEIKRTKMWIIKKHLDNFETQDEEMQLYLIKIVFKYNTINRLFEHGIQYNVKNLYDAIGGKFDVNKDVKHTYNHYLFEFTTALNFALSYKCNNCITMLGRSDVVIDNELVIECKYISSPKKIKSRLSECINQINTRVANKEAKFGLVALNLTEMINLEDIQNFTDSLMLTFIKSYKNIYKNSESNSLLKLIAEDKNFQQIVTCYASHQAEAVLYSKLQLPIKMSENVKGIIHELQTQLVISYEEATLPIPIRGKSYHLNHNLSQEEYTKYLEIIHNLAVGI